MEDNFISAHNTRCFHCYTVCLKAFYSQHTHTYTSSMDNAFILEYSIFRRNPYKVSTIQCFKWRMKRCRESFGAHTLIARKRSKSNIFQNVIMLSVMKSLDQIKPHGMDRYGYIWLYGYSISMLKVSQL